MRDVLLRIEEMGVASDLPILVDCDAGFGDADSVRLLVRRAEHASVAGVCIEDKCFPKRNSLGNGTQILESIDIFADKIAVASAARSGSDLVIVARIEALIAGAGLGEALRRAYAYMPAGADAILVHSRAKDVGEVAAFAAAWTRSLPMLVLPTTYPQVTEAELERIGFAGCIYANQALRASMTAISRTYDAIYAQKTAAAVEAHIASMGDVLSFYDAPRTEGAVIDALGASRSPVIAADERSGVLDHA
jgi:phosphoenolpyruvate phosphomutase